MHRCVAESAELEISFFSGLERTNFTWWAKKAVRFWAEN